MKKRACRKKLIMQKVMGLVLLLICGVVIMMASTGANPADKDVTPILLLGPLGLYLIFTKHIVIY